MNLCLTLPREGKLNLLLYLFPLPRRSISNSEPPKHNQLSELQWQRMQNADKTLQTFFSNEERKDDLVQYPWGVFFPPLLVKENYSLHPLREKSITPNKSPGCCPFSVVLNRTLANVDFMSYALLCFFLKVWLSGWQWSDIVLYYTQLTPSDIYQGAVRVLRCWHRDGLKPA